MNIYQVDAFTDRRFSGNPAGVCIMPGPPGEEGEKWMQDVAREMNLSETAFIFKEAEAFSLRWFTPAVEVDLCGHATLASAHVIWETGIVDRSAEIRFDTRSGPLFVNWRDGWIEMNFPAEPESAAVCPEELKQALGVEPLYTGKNRFDYLLELESEKLVRELQPDFRLLGSVDMRGVMVTARSAAADFDFVSRFFAPAVGVDEDPVTGSSHCCLGPYWEKRLGRNPLTGLQVSSRGGVVKVKNAGKRVLISGKAVSVLKGELV
jgi:PhzF family phenazine biosynthesis protein